MTKQGTQNRIGERRVFLDMLRIAATCAVVLLHTITGVMDHAQLEFRSMEKTVFLVIMDWITWCVPVFVMISGYLFLNPNKKITRRDILWKYCRRIVYALFFFGIPYSLMELVAVRKSFGPDMLWESIWMVCTGRSWSHLWYLYLILLLYLVTVPIRFVLSKIPRKAVYAVLALLVLFSSVLPYVQKLLSLEGLPVLPDVGIYFFYYMEGYLMVTANKSLRPRNRRLAWGLVAALILGMTMSRLVGDYTVQMAYNYPFTVLLSILFMLLGQSYEEADHEETYDGRSNNIKGVDCKAAKGKEIGREGKLKILQTFSNLSFAVYLIHPFYINVFYKVLHLTPLDFFIGFSLPLFFGLVLVLAIASAWLIRKIPFVRDYIV